MTPDTPLWLQSEGMQLESPLASKVFLLHQAQESGKAELARSLGHRRVSGELHKQIGRLQALGLIAMTHPEIPQSRLQPQEQT